MPTSNFQLPTSNRNLRIAIVHDWLVGGGAERVVLELHKMFPDAPIYTSYCTPEWRRRLDGKVVTGFLQRWPFGPLRKYVGILRIWWFTRLDLSGYNLVISSCGNGEAKGVKVGKWKMEDRRWQKVKKMSSVHRPTSSFQLPTSKPIHICYCHSPVHYYWRHYDQYMRQPGFGWFNPLARLGLKLLVGPLRKWDLKAAQRPDYFIANSNHIKADIKKYYGRDSAVIHPPVNTERFEILDLSSISRGGFITVGRQTGYKHTDLIVKACTKLALPLTVMGNGPEHKALTRMAGPTVDFIVGASDEEVARRLAGAQGFLFAAFEDFGVTPVEAMAAGTPVIAYKAGGALDYVVEGQTGLFFNSQAVEPLTRVLQKFQSAKWDNQKIQRHAQQFSAEHFRASVNKFISEVTKQ